jgi:hypothetical protein
MWLLVLVLVLRVESSVDVHTGPCARRLLVQQRREA